MADCTGMKIGSPQKSTLGSSSKFWLAVNFVKIHSENIAVTDTASLYYENIIFLKGIAGTFQKKLSGFKMILLIFFTSLSTWNMEVRAIVKDLDQVNNADSAFTFFYD